MHQFQDDPTFSNEPTQFFVETTTPRDGSVKLQRAVTMGNPDAPVDFLDPQDVKIDIRVVSKRLVLYVLATTLFVTAFTIVFYFGIPVDHIYEEIGSSKKSEELVETYNTYSGYALALVEILFSMHTDKFLPVFDVYVHNALWFLNKATNRPEDKKFALSPAMHKTVLFVFPIFLTLTMCNSIVSLQAASSSAGFKHIMKAEDLKREAPLLDLVRAAAKNKTSSRNTTTASTATSDGQAVRGINDIILKNAIIGQATPFTFATKSPCAKNETEDEENGEASTAKFVLLNVHDLDATSAVYGFVPREWNSEAIDKELEPTSTYKVRFDEVIVPDGKTPKAGPADFSLTTAFDIFLQGKVVIEKSFADSTRRRYPCWLSDGLTNLDSPEEEGSGSDVTGDATVGDTGNTTTDNSTTARRTRAKPAKAQRSWKSPRRNHRVLQEESSGSGLEDEGDDSFFDAEDADQWEIEGGVRVCEGAVSSLVDMGEFYKDPSLHTIENLMTVTAYGINKTFDGMAVDETEIILETYKIGSNIKIEAMRIDTLVPVDTDFGLNPKCSEAEDGVDPAICSQFYTYSGLSDSFCGSTGCAFLDASGTFFLQREIGMIPYSTGCTLDTKNVRYSSDFRGFYPTNCKKQPRSAFLYGIGTYLSGDEYGSNDTYFGTEEPYIIAPRRHLSFTFAKMTWELEDLEAKYSVDCGLGKGKCMGLSYQLNPSGRYLFAGEEALPEKKLHKADFTTPIPLVQLNSPSLFVKDLNTTITLERVNPKYFNVTKWDPAKNETLSGGSCSMLIDSYLNQINTNNYFLERPLQAMYTSAFYYLMANAGVTAINDTSLATNATALNASKQAIELSNKKDTLGNVKLTGDRQVRKIRVAIPASSFYTTLGGVAIVLILSVLILVFPTRRIEYFDEDTSKGQEYLAMMPDEEYPDAVLHKTLLFPATGETLDVDDVQVERMALIHEANRDRRIYL